MAIELTVDHVPGAPRPTIVVGFSSDQFSQAVYLSVDENPLNCVEMANNLAQSFIDACGRAVKEFKERNNVPDTFKASDDD